MVNQTQTQTPDAVIAFLDEVVAQTWANLQTLDETAQPDSRNKAYQALKLNAATCLRAEAMASHRLYPLESLMNECAKVLRNPAEWGEAGVDLAHNVLLTIARSL